MNSSGRLKLAEHPTPGSAGFVSIIGVFKTCKHSTGRSTRAIAKIVRAQSVRFVACSLPEEVGACGKGNKAYR